MIEKTVAFFFLIGVLSHITLKIHASIENTTSDRKSISEILLSYKRVLLRVSLEYYNQKKNIYINQIVGVREM